MTDAKDCAPDLDALVHTVADPTRFTGLDPEWFWVDTFQVPAESYWYMDHAEEVFLLRQKEKLFFGVFTKICG